MNQFAVQEKRLYELNINNQNEHFILWDKSEGKKGSRSHHNTL